jgi:cytochrome P450
VLILAGYETTANALAFAIYLLSANPGKRDALLAEVDGFGRARVPTLHDLDR